MLLTSSDRQRVEGNLPVLLALLMQCLCSRSCNLLRVILFALLANNLANGQNSPTGSGGDQGPDNAPSTQIVRPGSVVTQITPSVSDTNSGSNAKQIVRQSDFPQLKPKSDDDSTTSGQKSRLTAIAAPIITMITSLTIVLGLFAGLVWFSRRFSKRSLSSPSIPNELLEPLASKPLDPSTQMHVVRFANRIVLLAQNNNVIHTLCEIKDPEEVGEVLQRLSGDSINEFANALKQMDNDE